jgi:hypothetical protein
MASGLRQLPVGSRRAFGAIALLVWSVAACRGDDAATVPELSVIADDDGHVGDSRYAFEMPGRMPAGPTRVVLTNNSNEPHQAELFRLDEWGTAPDLAEALESGDASAADDFGRHVGGTGLVEPGEMSRADAVVDLDPGEYVVVCSEGGPGGEPHHSHDIVRPLLVIK